MIVYKTGQHMCNGVVVNHTDYIHPEYGYYRFNELYPENVCMELAKKAHQRIQNAKAS